MTREPTSERGQREAQTRQGHDLTERTRRAKRVYGKHASPDAILAADGSNRVEYLAWHGATHERKRAESRAADRDPGLPWDEYAAELDAREVHYGGIPLFAGAYTEQQFSAAVDLLRQDVARREAELNEPAPPMTPEQRAHVDRTREARKLQPDMVPTDNGPMPWENAEQLIARDPVLAKGIGLSPRAVARVKAAANPAAHVREREDAHPTRDELAAMTPEREWLYGAMAKVEDTPEKMAARLDRIDRHHLEDGRPREWPDDYRASKGLPAFEPVGPRFKAQVRNGPDGIRSRRWDPEQDRPGPWSGGQFSDTDSTHTAAEVLAGLPELDPRPPFTG